jgi:hypothetical protein
MNTEPRPPRNRRSREQWRQLIDEQQASELSQAAFCQARGIALSSFGYWKRRLARPTAPDWLELPVDLSGSANGWEIKLSLGDGVVLRLKRG